MVSIPRQHSLTVGSLNQPSITRNLMELPENAEKGLSQRFLWLIPKPVYGEFDSLELTDKNSTRKKNRYNCTLSPCIFSVLIFLVNTPGTILP